MSEKTRNFKIVFGCLLIISAGTGLLPTSVGVFVLPVTKALGISRGAFLFCNTVTILVSAFSLLFFDRIFNNLTPSKTILICGFICCGVPLYYSFLENIYLFYIGAFINGFFINGITMPLIFPVLKANFPQKTETYMGITFSGMALTSLSVVPILQFINNSFSYKWGYRLISVLGAIMLLAGAFLLKGQKSQITSRRLNKNELLNFFKLGKTPIFSCLALFLGNLINLALYNNLVPYLKDLGQTQKLGAVSTSVCLGIMIGAKPLAGFIFNKKGAKTGSLFLSIMLVAASLSMIFLKISIWFLISLLPALAFCGCFNSIPAGALSKDVLKNASQSFTVLMICGYLGSAAGSSLAAFLYDSSNSYKIAWWIILSLSCITFILFKNIKSQAE